MNAVLVATVLTAIVAAAGSVFAAIQSRKAQERAVDVQLVKLMQEEVAQLHLRVGHLRNELITTQDQNDEWRAKARKLQFQVDEMEYRINRLIQIIKAAGLQVDDPALNPPADV